MFQINNEILVFLFQMLSHPFPRVRRFTADHLYVRLLEGATVVPNQASVDPALEILLEAPWDADLRVDEVRELNGKLADVIGINISSDEKLEESVVKEDLVTDEFASYASLVNSV